MNSVKLCINCGANTFNNVCPGCGETKYVRGNRLEEIIDRLDVDEKIRSLVSERIKSDFGSGSVSDRLHDALEKLLSVPFSMGLESDVNLDGSPGVPKKEYIEEIVRKLKTECMDKSKRMVFERELVLIYGMIGTYKGILNYYKENEYEPTPYCKSKGLIDETTVESTLTLFDDYELVEYVFTKLKERIKDNFSNVSFNIVSKGHTYEYVLGFDWF